MEEHNIQLTTPEISALWSTYIQNSATICFFKHFQQYLQDTEIKSIVDEALLLGQSYINNIETIFTKENFPIPKGFSDKDIDLSAPALYTDLFALSFTYHVGQMAVPYYATVLTKVARKDVVKLFDECLQTRTNLYKKSLNLMLSKGIYDRPPKIPYPKKVEPLQKQQSLIGSLFGATKPMNALELGEIFYTIERNYIGLILIMGLIQVMKDKEIKEFLIKGKKLTEKQVDIFNKILKEDEHLGNIPVSIEVTDSTVSPFSDRLILFLIATTTSTGVYLLANTMSTAMRKDLVFHYSILIPEIMNYGKKGLEIMINRGWMDQPPQPVNRHDLYKT
jgi:Protein of unknown function (DUF3231)